MDYEKKYNEALSQARFYYGNCPTEPEKKKLEILFPELRESEDERIWKAIDEIMKLDKAWEIAGEHGLTAADIRRWVKKQKEPNGEDEECTDFTIYHPIKNGKGKYECIPYSFYGSLTSFSEDKDLIDFLRTCFYTEEECNEWIEQQEEQKPAEWSEEDKNMWTHLNGYLNGFSCSEDAIKQMADWFYELPNRFNLQPKQEWSEEDAANFAWFDKFFRAESVVANGRDIPQDKYLWFKSLRPQSHWKPSENQMSMLLAVINDPSNAGSESCHLALTSLYNYLNKQM